MAIPQAAVDLAKRFEGFHRVPKGDPARTHPYICSAGYWTIGDGHLCERDYPPVTQKQAEALLTRDLRAALATIIDFTLRSVPLRHADQRGRSVPLRHADQG